MKSVIKLLLVLVLVYSNQVFGQNSECKLTLANPSISIENLLYEIEVDCGISFSYNASVINGDSIVSVDFKNIPISTALKSVLGKDLIIKPFGKNYIIKLPKKSTAPKTKEKVKIKGVITDKRTNEKLRDVTVFTAEDLKPVLTDSTGAFEIEIDDPAPQTLVIKKEDYIDTLIIVTPQPIESDEFKLISLDQIPELKLALDSIKNQLDSLSIMKWFSNNDFQKHAKNLGESLLIDKPFQISLVPGVSTNGKFNSASTNVFSFNVIGGYTGTVTGFEFGSVFNIVKHKVNGVQIGGFSNIVGGELNGLQIGGFSNISLNNTKGGQIAGFVNIAKGTSHGFQISGFSNISTNTQYGMQVAGFSNFCPKDVNGAQFAGFFNYGNTLDGTQVSGFANISPGQTRGTQISGFLNSGTRLSGSQFSGFVNVGVHDTRGVQIAGFYNHSGGTMRGVQIAGFINYARKLRGMQIGLINIIPDSVQGLPIGLLTIAPKGYTRLQLEYSQTIPFKASIKTGVKPLHNILSFGYIDQDRFALGYGLGTMLPIGKHFGLTLNATADQFVNNSFQTNDLDLLVRLATGVTFRIGKRFEIFATHNLNSHFFESGISLGSDLYQDLSQPTKIEAFQDWSVGIRI